MKRCCVKIQAYKPSAFGPFFLVIEDVDLVLADDGSLLQKVEADALEPPLLFSPPTHLNMYPMDEITFKVIKPLVAPVDDIYSDGTLAIKHKGLDVLNWTLDSDIVLVNDSNALLSPEKYVIDILGAIKNQMQA